MTPSARQSPTKPYPARDPQLMYELAKDRLTCQLNTIDALDGKIAMLVSMASALLGIAAAVLAFRVAPTSSSSSATTPSNTPALVTLSIGGLIYLVVVYHGIRAYFSRVWSIGPSLDGVWDQHKTSKADDEIKWGVANDFLYCYENNEPSCGKKTAALRWVLFGAVLETAVLVTALSLVAAGA